MIDNYAGYPLTVGEIRAENKHDAALWSPRDLLINMLRDIDEGKYPDLDVLAVFYRYAPPDHKTSDDCRVGWMQSSESKHTTIGVAYQALNMLAQPG